jgi:aminoglycoside phosphotransferase family enzyme/predicted kinase
MQRSQIESLRALGPAWCRIPMSQPPSHPELIGQLACAAALGVDPAKPVDVVHTHASTVLLCGDRAWKVKKPVQLGFLDFSTLERRHADCAREIELNRRLAPGIYLGLSAVVRRGPALQMVDAPAIGEEVIEWAVRMRRMPADGMLDRLVPAGGVTPEHMRDFARQLADFHASARAVACTGVGSQTGTGDLAEQSGSADDVARRLRGNLARLSGAPLEPAFLGALRVAAERWLERISPTLHERRAQGRVCDGHGDLHTRNLCMIDGQITAYDCLEFDDSLRCADVAADVGFLAMDLARLGRNDLAREFIAEYVRASGDGSIAEPARFFGFHYAIVRAMVEWIRLGQSETPAAERPAIIRAIRDFTMLAAGYAVEPATVLMMGLPATGKSTLGRALARHMRATVIESDRVRKELHGVAPTGRGPPEIYGADATGRTYAALADRVTSIRGSAVIDASHHTRAARASSIAAAISRTGPWLLLEVDADRATIEGRMRRRAQDPSSVSDATMDVHKRLLARRESPEDVDAGHRLLVRSHDGDDWIDGACQRALAQLMLSCQSHGVPSPHA